MSAEEDRVAELLKVGRELKDVLANIYCAGDTFLTNDELGELLARWDEVDPPPPFKEGDPF